MRRMLLGLLALVGLGGVACSAWAANEVIDPEIAKQDPDFALQGEYLGTGALKEGGEGKVGAQVIALGKGQFEAVLYKGGLPGAGWGRGDESARLAGARQNGVVEFKGEKLAARIEAGAMTVMNEAGEKVVTLAKTERKSPTLGAKPPEGAVVLYDGESLEAFEGHVEKGPVGLISGVTTKQSFEGPYRLHLEYLPSWMPEAKGQGRSNSGVYIGDAYEIQVLDSFGLKGENNEAGGFYSIKAPDVNMALPPMTWQTYDIEYTPPRYEGDQKVANARISVQHNGVVIHDNIELPKGTPGRKPEGPGPRPLHLQGHGNKVQYRNIWLLPLGEKK